MSKLTSGLTIVAAIGFAGMAYFVMRLASENRELKATITTQATARMTAGAPRVGDTVPTLRLLDATGEFELNPASSTTPTLILQHSAGCSYCESTMPVWTNVLKAAGAKPLRVVCVQTDARTAAQLMVVPPELHPCAPISLGTSWLQRTPVVPSAMLISPSGVIIGAWHGAMDAAQGQDLLAAILNTDAH